MAQELGCDHFCGPLVQLDIGELAGPIDGHEEIELAFRGLHLGDVDVEVTDRVVLEFRLGRLVAFDLRQAAECNWWDSAPSSDVSGGFAAADALWCNRRLAAKNHVENERLMIERFEGGDYYACFLAVRPPLTYHLADIADDGHVREFRTSDTSDIWINGGYFLFRPEVFDFMREGEELVLEPFRRLIAADKLMAYKHEGFWCVLSGGAARAAEAKASAEAFLRGAREYHVDIAAFDDSFFPDQTRSIKEWLLGIQGRSTPDVIFTHTRHDAHQDHREVNRLTWNVFRDHLILEYDIPKWDGDLCQPNVYVPLAREVLDRKISLLNTHFGSQRSKDWFDRETFEGLARLRGLECRAPDLHAEAFVMRKARLF